MAPPRIEIAGMPTTTARREIDAMLEAIARRADDEAEASRRQAQLASSLQGREVSRLETAAWRAVGRWLRHTELTD
jgi:hypothetical protein